LRISGISAPTFHRWKKRYGGLSQTELTKIKGLESENARLKRLLAERDLEIDAIKEVLSKKW
jgi:putative transposase